MSCIAFYLNVHNKQGPFIFSLHPTNQQIPQTLTEVHNLHSLLDLFPVLVNDL